MKNLVFSLQPFDKKAERSIVVNGEVRVSDRQFEIEYALLGAIDSLVIPPFNPPGQRRDELWQMTCLEFFLAVQDSPQYWEFNLAPSGDWNIYRFADYRQGMEEERAISQLPFQAQSRENGFFLCLEADLTAILPQWEGLEIAIAAVIQTKTGDLSYWALNHCGAEADFHRRDSFIAIENKISEP